jgi:GcrA cell cycle regulator
MEWTQELIGDLTRLWSEGLTTSEIGKKLGISKNAVVGKAHRLHLSARPSPIRRLARGSVIKALSPAPMHAPRPAQSAPKRVVELSAHGCRWPIGHPGDSDFHFCTDRALVGKPYCAEHAALAYVRVKPKAGEAA